MKKVTKSNILCLIFALAVVTSSAQLARAQFLADEFGELPCEDISARIYVYISQLAKEGDASGWVQTFAPKEKFLYSLQIESQIFGEIESFNAKSDIKVDPNSIVFEYGGIEEAGRTRFWIIPRGTEDSIELDNKLPLELAKDARPFRFRSVSRDAEGSDCIFGKAEEQFGDLLQANPLAKGNLVIADKNRKALREKKKELLGALAGIDPDRLRFFFVKSETPYVEYWIVPKK